MRRAGLSPSAALFQLRIRVNLSSPPLPLHPCPSPPLLHLPTVPLPSLPLPSIPLPSPPLHLGDWGLVGRAVSSSAGARELEAPPGLGLGPLPRKFLNFFT